MADFLGGLQCPHVIAPRQDAPSPTKEPVDRPGKPRPDRLHAARQGILIRSLYDEVRVIVLHRVHHDAKVLAPTHCPEAALKDSQEWLATHRGHAAHDPNGDMRRMPLQHFVSLDMMDDWPRGGRPSGSRPRSPAPRLHSHVSKCKLPCLFHRKIMAYFSYQVNLFKLFVENKTMLVSAPNPRPTVDSGLTSRNVRGLSPNQPPSLQIRALYAAGFRTFSAQLPPATARRLCTGNHYVSHPAA